MEALAPFPRFTLTVGLLDGVGSVVPVEDDGVGDGCSACFDPHDAPMRVRNDAVMSTGVASRLAFMCVA